MYNIHGVLGQSPQHQQIAETVPAPDESPSKILDAVNVTEQLLSDLHIRLEMLRKRLDTVLLPPTPSVSTTSPNVNKPSASGSHLLGRMSLLNEGYGHAIERIHDLLLRLEI